MPSKASMFIYVVLIIILFAGLSGVSLAAVPYRNYTYDFWGRVAPSPQAYVPMGVISGMDLGVGEFNRPNDIFVDDLDQIYVLDSGNNRIVVFDSDGALSHIIDRFVNNNGAADSFKSPEGLFVTSSGNIFVADTGNSRIVELDAAGAFIRQIGNPWVDYADVRLQEYSFQPSKVAVDRLGRIYVVCNNLYEGLVCLNSDGGFTGFIGAPRVTLTVADLFWYRIATDEQRERMQLFLPTQLRNLDLDNDGLIFVVKAGDADDDAIKRLNPAGNDVLIRNGFHPPKGDLASETPSRFFDVVVVDDNRYAVLDHVMGRVFTYNFSGELLYVFGAIGEVVGSFRDPVAIDCIGDHFLVLDRGRGLITVFKPTAYAQAINDALDYYHRGKYDKAAEMWQQVLRYNANYDLAYTGVGRSLLQDEEYDQAAEYFKLGNNRRDYSKAFGKHRKHSVEKNFSSVFNSILICGALIFLINRYDVVGRIRKPLRSRLADAIAKQGPHAKRRVKQIEDFIGSIKYAGHVIFHPFDGFWDLKHEKRGTKASATFLLALTTAAYVFMRQYTGFVINERDIANMNLVMELASVLVPFMLWVLVNWAFTTLLEGKGTLSDIYMATAYALVPLIILMIPATIVSNFVTIEEATLVKLVVYIALMWSAVLLIISNIVIHEYSGLKTILTVMLTIGGIVFALFLGLLFFSLVNTMTSFFSSIYLEIIFR